MPNNIRNAIIEGLQKLVALRLKGAPPESTIAGTGEVWLETLDSAVKWRQDDEQRVRQTFAVLFASSKDFPSPSHFLDSLVPRPKPQQLPQPKISATQQAKNRQIINSIIKDLGVRKCM